MAPDGSIANRIFRFSRFARYPALVGLLAGFAVAGSLAANLIFVILGWQGRTDFWQEFAFGLRIAMFMTILLGATTMSFEVLSDRLQAAREELRRRELDDERARQRRR